MAKNGYPFLGKPAYNRALRTLDVKAVERTPYSINRIDVPMWRQ
jgi:hypothetical protein